MKTVVYIVIIFIICCGDDLSAQHTTSDSITAPQVEILSDRDSTTFDIGLDTLPKLDILEDSLSANNNTDSLATQSKSRGQTESPYQVSKDQPEKPIDYGSTDSSYLDVKNNRIHLFGDAYVKYGKYNLDAGYIIFDFGKNEASAFDTLPNGITMKKPSFTDGENDFTATSLRYNFKSNKGLILNAISEEGEFQVHGSRTKFVSSEADSMSTSDQIYNKNAVITTCTDPIPHYGIRSRKLKIVPNRLAVAGLSQLEIAGIPTPLILPFGFYPLVDGLSSGIIFPLDFDANPNLGLGIRGVGYYFPLSDYIDLTLTGDFYSRGTHRIKAVSHFKKKYKYNGQITLQYANNIVENPEDLSRVSNKGFGIKITRNQESKAHPYRTISGSIDVSTGDFYSTNYDDYERATKNVYTSSFNYRNTLPGTPLSIKVGMSHYQNTRSNEMKITLPDAKLTLSTIFPFKHKIPSSTEKWYEKITVRGSSAAKAFVSTTDSTLFTQETLDKLETGIYNEVSTSASFKALKYFTISPNIKANQYIFFRTLHKDFIDSLILDTIGVEMDQDSMITAILFDTTYGTVNEQFLNGTEVLHKFSTGVSVSTKIFGTKNFSKGWLRGLRHMITPSVSYTFSPSTLDRQKSVQRTLDPSVDEEDRDEEYNPFRGGSFNPRLSDESQSISFSLVNNFEGKYYSKKDSTEKKFNIFKSITLNTNYNFARDSIKWSPLKISGNTKLTKFTSLNFNASYDFYVKKDGRLTAETIWSKNKRPVQFDKFDLTLTTGFKLKDIIGLFSGSSKKNESTEGNTRDDSIKPTKEGVGFLETLENFKIAHNFKMVRRHQEEGGDTTFVSIHTLRLSGSLQLTPQWKVTVQNISYDLVKNKFVYPAFTLTRDLHCWNMNFSWYPKSGVYSFFIGVKSTSLSFLKYNYGRQSSDVLSGFGR